MSVVSYPKRLKKKSRNKICPNCATSRGFAFLSTKTPDNFRTEWCYSGHFVTFPNFYALGVIAVNFSMANFRVHCVIAVIWSISILKVPGVIAVNNTVVL